MTSTTERLTPLAIMVLALLREGDMHPYEMARLLRSRRDDRLVTVTNGALYHTVRRLQERGLLAEVGVDREGNRPERTTYSLAASGREAVAAWVRRELGRPHRPVEFRVALAEAHNLARDEVVGLLRQRRDFLDADSATHHEGLATARGRGIAEQFLVEVDRESALLTAELAWLDGLIDRIDSGVIDWGVDHLDPAMASHLSENRTLPV